MFKRTSLIPAVTLAALVVLPATSQARDCLGLDRVGHGVVKAAGDVGRTVTRVGDTVLRTGDRLLSWMLCDKRRM